MCMKLNIFTNIWTLNKSIGHNTCSVIEWYQLYYFSPKVISMEMRTQILILYFFNMNSSSILSTNYTNRGNHVSRVFMFVLLHVLCDLEKDSFYKVYDLFANF